MVEKMKGRVTSAVPIANGYITRFEMDAPCAYVGRVVRRDVMSGATRLTMFVSGFSCGSDAGVNAFVDYVQKLTPRR